LEHAKHNNGSAQIILLTFISALIFLQRKYTFSVFQQESALQIAAFD